MPIATPTNTYPVRVMKLLRADRAFSHVVGINGTTYAQRTVGGGGASAASTRVDPLLRNSTRITLVDTAGQSDLLAGMSAAATLAAAEAYHLARKAAAPPGVEWKSVILTVIPFAIGGAFGFTAPMETQRLAYNNLLRANANGVFDAVVDVAARPEVANPNDVAVLPDGLHFSDAIANSVMAPMVADAITAVAPFVSQPVLG